jgi:oligopeptide/dipeptide ABC transporter ATP-binding protein
MMEIKEKREGAAIMLITHDLAVVAETCQRVIVMYGGKIQETAEIEAIFEDPLHPYTKGLLNSLPRPDLGSQKRLFNIPGTVPSILNMPIGCKFSNRCSEAKDICHQKEPGLAEIKPGRWVRCHLFPESSEAK